MYCFTTVSAPTLALGHVHWEFHHHDLINLINHGSSDNPRVAPQTDQVHCFALDLCGKDEDFAHRPAGGGIQGPAWYVWWCLVMLRLQGASPYLAKLVKWLSCCYIEQSFKGGPPGNLVRLQQPSCLKPWRNSHAWSALRRKFWPLVRLLL